MSSDGQKIGYYLSNVAHVSIGNITDILQRCGKELVILSWEVNGL